jgi:hypothetical protein
MATKVKRRQRYGRLGKRTATAFDVCEGYKCRSAKGPASLAHTFRRHTQDALMIRPFRIVRPLGATALAALALAGCSSDKPKAPTCPYAAVIVPTSTLTTFKPGMHNDPSGELYTVGITNVRTDCTLDADNGTTDSTLALSFKAKRTASPNSASYRVPYFVAVVLDGKVLAKHDIWANFGFAPGNATTVFDDEVASTVINLENGRKPYEYEIVVGLQLTHDQLEYNKKMSRFAP